MGVLSGIKYTTLMFATTSFWLPTSVLQFNYFGALLIPSASEQIASVRFTSQGSEKSLIDLAARRGSPSRTTGTGTRWAG